jgi:hypothetical protein
LDFKQETFILGQPRQKAVPRTSRLQLVRTCKDLTVLLHLIGAEKFRSQRWLVAGVLMCQAGSLEKCHKIGQDPVKGFAAHLQI